MIRIALDDQTEGDVAFAVSPLLECVLSLHVLLGPKHHSLHHDWVRRMRRTLDPDLRRALAPFGFVFRTQLADLFLPIGDGEPETFEDGIERVRGVSADRLLAALARPIDDHGGSGRIDPAAVAARGGHALLADPVGFADRLTTFLERYWRAAFADEWKRIEPVLRRAVVESGRRRARYGVWAVLGRLPSHCRVDAETNELLIRLPHDHAIGVGPSNPLILCPSVFVWPDLRVNCDPPWPNALVYAAGAVDRAAAPTVPPANLVRVLRALGDDTRLRVLRLLAARPRSTQELAQLVGLSPTGLSKSLQRLAEAGLVTSRREGYYVVYSLVPGGLEGLAEAVAHYLGEDG